MKNIIFIVVSILYIVYNVGEMVGYYKIIDQSLKSLNIAVGITIFAYWVLTNLIKKEEIAK